MVWQKSEQRSDLHEWYRGMIALRRAHPVLRRGTFVTMLTDDVQKVYVFARKDDTSCAVVALNAGVSPAHVVLPLGALAGTGSWQVVQPAGKPVEAGHDGKYTAVIPGMSGTVFLNEKK